MCSAYNNPPYNHGIKATWGTTTYLIGRHPEQHTLLLIYFTQETLLTFKECEKKSVWICSLYVGSLFPLVLISSLWTTSKGGGAPAFISSNDGHNEFHYTAFAFFLMIFVVVGGKGALAIHIHIYFLILS